MRTDKAEKLITTKVSAEAAARLASIAAAQGTSVYALLQMMCETIVRYMDDAHNLDPTLEKAMAIFDHTVGWGKCASSVSASAAEITEATYYFRQRGKEGMFVTHVELPGLGNPIATNNVATIFDRLICAISPDRYARMRRNAARHGIASVLSYIDHLLVIDDDDASLNDIRRSFEESTRMAGVTSQPYVRRLHRGMDNDGDRNRILDQDIFSNGTL